MDGKKNLSKKIASGISWSFFEKILTEVIGFIITIVLARLLLPEAYGLVSLISIFITISQVIVSSGLGTALVQKKTPDSLDYSTLFIANIILGLSLYGVLFVIAPIVANFYRNQELCLLLRVLALRLPISSVYNIQLAYVQKKMCFKKLFFSSLAGTIMSGFVGVIMAYNGFGAWALVWSNLTDLIMDSIILFITTKWVPQIKFSKDRFYKLNSFAWKVTLTELINRAYDQVRSLYIGRAFTSADLAYNTKAQKFPLQIIETVNTTVIRVMFPALSQVQDNKEKLIETSKFSVKMISFCLSPLMIGMAVTAPQFVPVLLTHNWDGCIPYIQLYCITYLIQPIQSVNIKMIQAIGRSDVSLLLEIIKKLFGIISLILAIVFINTPFAVAANFTVLTFFSLIVNAIPCRKLIGYGLFEEIKDTIPSMVCSLIMGATIAFIPMIINNELLTLIVQVALGAIIYLLVAWLLKVDQLKQIYYYIKGHRER